MLGPPAAWSRFQRVELLPSMPKKALRFPGMNEPGIKPLERAQESGTRDRLLDETRGEGGGWLTSTTIWPAVGAAHSKETSSRSPGKSGFLVLAVPSSVPPAAGSPR